MISTTGTHNQSSPDASKEAERLDTGISMDSKGIQATIGGNRRPFGITAGTDRKTSRNRSTVIEGTYRMPEAQDEIRRTGKSNRRSTYTAQEQQRQWNKKRNNEKTMITVPRSSRGQSTTAQYARSVQKINAADSAHSGQNMGLQLITVTTGDARNYGQECSRTAPAADITGAKAATGKVR